MALDRCIDDVVAAGASSRKEAERLLDLVDARAERIARERGLSPADAARAAGEELVAAEAAAAAIEKRNAALNLQKRIGRRQTMLDTAHIAARKNGEPDYAHAVTNQIVGRNTPAPGSRASAEAVWKARQGEYAGALVLALNKAGLLGTFRKGTLADAWGRELYELSLKAAGEPDRVGITGNPQALTIARSIHDLMQLAKQRLNREGAWIGDYAGYITRTVHDPDKIRTAGFDAWRDFIQPRLGSRTFEGVDNPAKYLRDTWNALITGVHLTDREQVGMKDPAFTGPANLARQVSEGRKLHFTDATSWLQYQQRFGTGSLAEQTLSALDRAARQEALLRRWGTNPEGELANDMRWIEENQRNAHPDAVRALRDGRHGIETRMDYLTGQANRPANQTSAKVGAGIRAVESMAKLGGVAFTHLSAFATKAAELRYHGVGWLEAYGNSVAALLHGRGAGEARDIADLTLAGLEGMHGWALSRFTADDAVPGTVSKAANSFMRASFLTWLVDAQKAGMARTMARHLGMHADQDFGALPAELRRTLTTYGITPEEWQALRTAPDHAAVDGRVHITPDAAHRADEAAMGTAIGAKAEEPPAEEALAKARDDLALKVQTLFSDTANRGIITPGIDEKATFLGGARPGSVAGEVLRYIAQFKLWGAAAVRQGIGRELYGGQGVAGAIAGLMHMALGVTVMGYMVMTLKDLTKGKTPRNPLDPRTVAAAAMQGGGFGLLGDYAFGQFNRFGQSPIESAAGATAGVVSDVLQTISTARGFLTGDPNARPKDLGPELLRIVQGNTPFLNLFYLRRTLDYLLFHSLQESMNPGYLRRAERSMKQRTGQTFLQVGPIDLRPQNHLHTFGR